MESQQFIENALRTESRPESLGLNLGAASVMLEMLIAAGNAADTLKRGIYYGKGLNKDKLAEQLAVLKAAVETTQSVLPRLDQPEGYPVDLIAPNLRLLHCSLGLFTESSELLESIQRNIKGESLDLVNFGEELGDVDWYKAIGHDETGVSEGDVREAVVAKLKQRYGDKFTSEAATSRDLGAERAVLEDQLSNDLPGGEA